MRILLLLLAIASGLGAAWLILLRDDPEPPPAPEPAESVAMRDVLVIDQEIAADTPIEAQDLRWQSWPEDALQEDYILRDTDADAPSRIEGFVARSDLHPGDPVRPARLRDAGARAIAAQLESGQRAMAVRVSVESTAGGFVLPGDRIDLVHTTTPPEGGRSRSKTLVTNLHVLALDQRTQSDPDEQAAIGQTATLAVSPQQAEIITSAEREGRLTLVLRARADQDEPSQLSERAGERGITVIRSGRRELFELD